MKEGALVPHQGSSHSLSLSGSHLIHVLELHCLIVDDKEQGWVSSCFLNVRYVTDKVSLVITLNHSQNTSTAVEWMYDPNARRTGTSL